MVLNVNKVINRMLKMCPFAWYIFTRALQLSCFLLFAAFALLLRYNETGSTYLFSTAQALSELPQAILLLAVVFSAAVEDIHSSRR